MLRLRNAALVLLTLVLAFGSVACDRPAAQVQPAGGAKAISAQALPEREALYGGDTQAWLTPAGDAADSGYCRASLRLPLTREPAWISEYGNEFSVSEPTSMVHYDGLLVVAARCPQLLGIDVASGERLFNVDVYEHPDRDLPESFASLFFHPRGLLVGLDDQGRSYCWGLESGAPERWWFDERTGNAGGYVVSDDNVVITQQSSARCLAAVDGAEQWDFPLLFGNAGIVLSSGGTAITWSMGGEYNALSSRDGSLKWSLRTATGAPTWASWSARATIDDRHGLVYLLLGGEEIQCRELATGELRWEHSWSDLLSAAERERIFAAVNAEPTPLRAIGVIAAPEGPVVPMLHGSMIALDLEGRRRWLHRSSTLIVGGLGFLNGVLISELYIGPQNAQVRSSILAFCQQPPDWDSFQRADADSQLNGLYARLLVLSEETGETLDVFEPEVRPLALLPAGDKIIFGELSPPGVSARRILAYDWIAAEGT